MSINRKLKKYVEEMPTPEADKVLPEAAKNAKTSTTAKSSRGFMYAGVGIACAAVVGVVTFGVISNMPKNSVKGGKDNEVLAMGDTHEKPIVFGDGIVEGKPDTNSWGETVDSVDKFGVLEEMPAESPEFFEPSEEGKPQGAGTLTGGEMRDVLNWDNYVRNMSVDTLRKWCVISNNRVTVYVHNGDTALSGVKVKLLDGDKVIYSAITDIKGNAYLFHSYDGSSHNPTTVQVIDGQEVTNYDLKENANSKNEIEIDLQKENDEITVDLLYMIDTTGSMGDELEYLKLEIQDVIERTEAETGKKIRTSVNFYRDETDEYVVKYFDFRDDAKEVAKIVGEQSADGGGDFPEAVCEAFDNALNNHNWNEKSIKLMFVVLDAPPHDDKAKELSKLIVKAAEMGVRIIPIMSSGADAETVSLFRSYAVMTGGTYLFLDDNSGVGDSHEIPSDAKDYDSEYLNAMMIRVIGEYVGVDIDTSKIELPSKPVQGN